MEQKLLTELAPKWRIQVWYIPILAIAMGLMMVRPLLMAGLFDPEEFATYSLGLLISSTFCVLGCLGIQPMIQRKMPMDFVAGKEKASLILLVQGSIVAVISVVIFSSLGFAGLSVASLSAEGFAISILHGLSQQLFILVTIESRSRGEPLRFSCQYLIRAGVVVTGATVLAFYTLSAYATLLIEAILSFIVVWRVLVGVIQRNSISLVNLFLSSVRDIESIPWRETFSLMAVMMIGFTLINVDRWLAATLLSPQEFAWYAFAWILLATSHSVQSIINSSVFPSLARRYALDGRLFSFTLAAKTSFILLILGIFFSWPAYYILRSLVSIWFEEYVVSVEIFPIFLVICVVRLSDFWSSYLIIIGREKLLIFINISVFFVVLAIWLSIIKFEAFENNEIMQLSWLALIMTVSNYFFVACAAINLRKK